MSRLRNTVKKWYLTFFKPTQSQFYFWMDSIWFKDEKIPANNIEGLPSLLNAKADSEMVNQQLLQKVDKVDNKGLSTNDYTTIEKNKLAGIEDGANKNVQSDWNATTGDAFIKNKPTIPAPYVLPTLLSNITQTDINNWNKIGLGLKELTTEDLNTVKESGFYLQSAWTRATATRNYPRKQSGYLTVFTKSNGMGYQTFVTEANIVYLRKARANGTFKSWQELKGSNYIIDDEETTAHTPQHYLDNHRLVMRTEFNTVSSLGLTAETGYCALKTFVSREVGKAVQQAFCFDTGKVYKRYATSPTVWSAWELNGGAPAPTVSQLQTSANITTSQLIDTHSQNGKHVMMLNGANNLTVTIDSADKFCSTYQKTGTGNITFVAGTGKTLVQVDSTNVISGAIGSSATVSIVGNIIYLRIANA